MRCFEIYILDSCSIFIKSHYFHGQRFSFSWLKILASNGTGSVIITVVDKIYKTSNTWTVNANNEYNFIQSATNSSFPKLQKLNVRIENRNLKGNYEITCQNRSCNHNWLYWAERGGDLSGITRKLRTKTHTKMLLNK